MYSVFIYILYNISTSLELGFVRTFTNYFLKKVAKCYNYYMFVVVFTRPLWV